MANIYVNRIIERANWTEDRFTIDNVPNLWKEETLMKLTLKGFDGYGQPLI